MTKLGTLVGLTVDLQSRVVVRTKVSTYVKNILGAFPIVKIQIVRGASHLQLAMLVEPDCICIVQASVDPSNFLGSRRIDLLNERDDLPLAYGLTQTDVSAVDQFIVNQHASDQ